MLAVVVVCTAIQIRIELSWLCVCVASEIENHILTFNPSDPANLCNIYYPETIPCESSLKIYGYSHSLNNTIWLNGRALHQFLEK